MRVAIDENFVHQVVVVGVYGCESGETDEGQVDPGDEFDGVGQATGGEPGKAADFTVESVPVV